MPKNIIPAPGIHPSLGAYSHVVEGIGLRTVFISGQVPLDLEGRLVGRNDLSAQAGQVLKNLSAALDAARARPDDIAKLTVFLAAGVKQIPDALPVLRNLLGDFFAGEFPANSLCYVESLASDDWLLEVEATALV